MKTITRILSGLVLSAVFLLPAVSKAYYTTDQTATRFSDTSALYTITYKFGSPNRDIYLPVVAERDSAVFDSSLVYEMLLDGKTYTDAGVTTGLVTSNAEIRNGQYFVPAGVAKTFRLQVVLQTDVNMEEADYAVHVTRLPFTMVTKDGTVIKDGLNASELSRYLTPEIELNEPDRQDVTMTITPIVSERSGLKVMPASGSITISLDK